MIYKYSYYDIDFRSHKELGILSTNAYLIFPDGVFYEMFYHKIQMSFPTPRIYRTVGITSLQRDTIVCFSLITLPQVQSSWSRRGWE